MKLGELPPGSCVSWPGGGPFRVSRGCWHVGKHISHSASPHENWQWGACLDPFSSQLLCPGRGSARGPLPCPTSLSPASPAPCPSAHCSGALGIHYAFLQISGVFVFPSLDTHLGYLSLLDANYDRRPPNKHFARAVNYTVCFQWVQCLFWEEREWKSAGFSPRPGTSPEKVSCRYRHTVEDKLETFRSSLYFLPCGARCLASLAPGPCENGCSTWIVHPSPSAGPAPSGLQLLGEQGLAFQGSCVPRRGDGCRRLLKHACGWMVVPASGRWPRVCPQRGWAYTCQALG